MKKVIFGGSFISLGGLPLVVFADAQQQAAQKAAQFVDTFNEVILFPIIALLSAVAFLVFVWGCAEYLMNAANDQGRQQGVKHITWGIIGLLIMVTAWGIMSLFAATFGLSNELRCADDPSGSGCADEFRLPNPGTGTPGSGPNPGTGTPGSGPNPGTGTPGSGPNPGAGTPPPVGPSYNEPR